MTAARAGRATTAVSVTHAQIVDGLTIGRARSIDLTPTAAAAVGIPQADHWRGRVLNAAIPEEVIGLRRGP